MSTTREPARERELRLAVQYLLALIPMWMNGDEDPTAADVIEVGGWDRVEASRERIEEIRELIAPKP